MDGRPQEHEELAEVLGVAATLRGGRLFLVSLKVQALNGGVNEHPFLGDEVYDQVAYEPIFLCVVRVGPPGEHDVRLTATVLLAEGQVGIVGDLPYCQLLFGVVLPVREVPARVLRKGKTRMRHQQLAFNCSADEPKLYVSDATCMGFLRRGVGHGGSPFCLVCR